MDNIRNCIVSSKKVDKNNYLKKMEVYVITVTMKKKENIMEIDEKDSLSRLNKQVNNTSTLFLPPSFARNTHCFLGFFFRNTRSRFLKNHQITS